MRATGERRLPSDNERDRSTLAGARVGSNGLLYVAGGYSNIRVFGVNVDGFRLAAGGELGIGSKAYVKLEQRYGNYQYGLDLWQTMIGAGIRF